MDFGHKELHRVESQ